MFEETEQEVASLQLEAISLPRQRRPPARIDSGSSAHTFQSTSAMYKQQYLTLVDTAIQSLLTRFNQSSFAVIKSLEDCLFDGVVSDVLKLYPEIDLHRLKLQLPMFRENHKCTTLHDATSVLQSSHAEVRQLFSEVGKLIRCLLVLPASSCEAERSFSALRRLKTYLRSTMTQQTLNNVAVCHVHKEALKMVPTSDIMRDFINFNSARQRLFGDIN